MINNIHNILIISSNFTGHGHKSIAESLCEKFSGNSDIKIHIVDGFSLGGIALSKIGKAYGPITRRAEDVWKLIWNISSAKPYLINEFIEFMIKNRFLNLLEKIKPDLILTLHPNFNGSVINILEEYNIRIPVVTLIADLVSISPLWADPRSDYIISPTREAKEKCIAFGVPEQKIKILGFPVRSRFYDNLDNYEESTGYNSSKPLRCIIMSGGEGVGNMKKIARILLDNFNCQVKIMAGRNMSLKNGLERSLSGKYGSRVEVYGFTKNVQDLMRSSDIAFTRGSPNVIMEAVACNIPLIVTGALPGQEEGNPKFVEKYNLGMICKDIMDIKIATSELIADNARKLNIVKDAEKTYVNRDAAENIVNFILKIGDNVDAKYVTLSRSYS